MIRFLHHVGLSVPDLEIGRAFYETFGLEARVSGQHLVLRCKGRPQDQIRLMPGSVKRLSYVAYGTDAEGLKQIRKNLKKHNVALQNAPFDIDSEGLWFQDPSSDWVHVCEGVESPALPRPTPDVNTYGRYRRIGERACDLASSSRQASPLRLGHLIKFSPDVDRSVAFYTQVLGMKVSDKAADILAFLRFGCGGDHHALGLAKSSHSGLHHLSFEVMDIDEIELGAQNLIAKGYTNAFGLGRHVGGSNYFHYIRDPWNSLVEYFWDIDVVPEDDSDWVVLNASGPHELAAVWAVSPPQEDFAQNYEAPADAASPALLEALANG
ncbi:Catechol 2,3-dioxygenase [Pseudomonas sp. NFACC02]|uniref:VOC family protein n=1 Tax=Pseudomonas sp. NFACC02 TaxID=1566250 RepID=UPI0008B7EE37|nr:VOC family protein [Pseudomonas sp. NFACC02]SER73367.1 Catechol 2,3-dioxygenase [Pseudomonas sp. NFACC02]